MSFFAGISRDSLHKRRSTGGKKVPLRKKRKFELGRPAAGTKVGYLGRWTVEDVHISPTRGVGFNWSDCYMCRLDPKESTK